jgi:hypothetical protein
LQDCEIIPCRAGVAGVYDAPARLNSDGGLGRQIVGTIERLSQPFGTRVEVKGGRVMVEGT